MTTYKQVEAEMLKLVKAQPDFKYVEFREKQIGQVMRNGVSCSYIDEDGEGSCIWGCALVNAGVPVEQIKQYEGEGISHVLQLLEIEHDIDEASFAEYVQSYQDRNYTWESALENALEDTGYEL